MALRNIIVIDEEKCNGCGLCAKACAEGAIKIISGKAKLISETYCDGLGVCIGHCPQNAITIEQREAKLHNCETPPKNPIRRQVIYLHN
jgi:MinD superfamily P-loop ATPase